MFEKILKFVYLFTVGAFGLALIIIDVAAAIVEFRWWALLVLPGGFIVFEIGFIAALILSDWVVYAVRNRTFSGFLKSVPELTNLKEENARLRETLIDLHNDLFDSCPVGNLTPEQSIFVQNVSKWQGKICTVINWRDMPK